jgi:hypothetical protein
MADTYDNKCYELAEAFLSDEPEIDTAKNRDQLAKDIQQVIEDFIESAKDGVAASVRT